MVRTKVNVFLLGANTYFGRPQGGHILGCCKQYLELSDKMIAYMSGRILFAMPTAVVFAAAAVVTASMALPVMMVMVVTFGIGIISKAA